MDDPSPNGTSTQNEFDEELALTFLTAYHALEQALVRAGFTQAWRANRGARPDWEQFTRHIEAAFDPESSPELMGAVYYLLGEPEAQELRQERLQATVPGEWSSPQSDLAWLSELVQRIRDRLLLQINFPGKAWGDDADIMAALLIVEAWSMLDPQVKSLLAHVH